MQTPLENLAVAAIVAALTTSILAGGSAIMRRLRIDPVPPVVAMDLYSSIYNDFIGE